MRAVLSPRGQQGSDNPAGRIRGVTLAERVFRIRESGIVVVLAMLVAVTASVQPRFLSSTNIQFILVDTTVIALLALGETMVVISRNVDLSVGSVAALVTVVTMQTYRAMYREPESIALASIIAVVAGIATGGTCGLVNGLVVTKLRIAPFVATWLIDTLKQPMAPVYYTFVYGVIGLLVMFQMKETNQRTLSD